VSGRAGEQLYPPVPPDKREVSLNHRLIVALALATTALFLPSESAAEPNWLKGAINRAEKAAIETDAPAIVIANEAEVTIKDDGSARRDAREAYKVLQPKGEDFAVLRQYIGPQRSIKNLKGWRIEPSGKSHKLKSDHIVEVGVGIQAGYYDDTRMMVATFDEVNSGDVVAFEYSMRYKEGIEGICQPFIFQTDLPVLHSRLTVDLPSGWQLCESRQNMEPITSSVQGDRYLWESGYLAYRQEEPFMLPLYLASRLIHFSAFSPREASAVPVGRWDVVSRWAWAMHDDKDGLTDSLRMFLDDRLGGLNTPEEKLASIAQFVREEIRYVAVEIDHGRLEPREASITLGNRFGDCKDKVTLMRSMLGLIGVTSYPVLACVEGVVDRDFPSPCQFDHVIAAVELTQIPGFDTTCEACFDGWLYIDPTHPTVELGRLPLGLHGSQVLRMSDDEVDLVALPEARPEANRRFRRAEVQLKANGGLSAEVSVVFFGHARASTVYSRQTISTDDLKDSYLQRASETMRSPSISDFKIGHDADSAWTKYRLITEHYPIETGGLQLLKVDIFHSGQPEELKKTDERHHAIWFGEPKLRETEVVWHLPPQLVADDKPDSVNAACAIASVSSSVGPKDSILVFRSTKTYTGGVMAVSEFDQARKFLRRLNAVGATRVLLNTSQ
jgi:hypothetical protein